VDKRDPLEQAIRNVKIATLFAAIAVCLVVADIIVLLLRR